MNAATANVEIIPVTTRSQQSEFIQFQFEHYRDDPKWMPPLLISERELLNFVPHPFYENAEIQTFLAKQDGVIVGRIAAIIDHGHNAFHKEQRGMFGFFESVDDQQVADALFNAAKDWFAAKEIHLMRGPANPSQNYTWGLLVEGFHTPPKFMMTYNKEYYERLILNFGFKKAQDLYAFLGHVDMLENLDPKLNFVADEAQRRFNVKVRPISKKHFAKDVESFLKIYNEALPGQWGFTPMTDGELREIAKGLKQLIVPELTTMAEIDGEPVATVFGLLDYNPLIKKAGGKLFQWGLPIGLLKILWGKRKIKTMRLISTNVVPAYQGWGLGLVLLKRLVPEIKRWGIQDAEFSWVLESNKLSRGTLERGGTKRDKTYRIYDYEP